MSQSSERSSDAADLNLWLGRESPSGYEAPDEFARIARALRAVQDGFTAGRPSREAAGRAADWLGMVERLLSAFAVDEPEQIAGRIFDDPGRGQALLPPLCVDTWDDTGVSVRTRFSRFHLGSNGAAHGGAIALLFDDLLGQLANAPGRPRARTAHIRVDYHRIVPIERVLVAVATVTNIEGRKISIEGELRLGEDKLASASGLFVQLRPGQP